ncbi:MAG: GNAT family N-acetyltransferase [Clostridia bacterium]|nr:GNAT family N-acetyltransferase [Clostridia bacterium]
MDKLFSLPEGHFVRPDAALCAEALKLTETGIGGAEIYTFLKTEVPPPESQLWLRVDGSRSLVGVYLFNGSRLVRADAHGDPYPELHILSLRTPPETPPRQALPLAKEHVAQIWLLHDGKDTLSEADEIRYVRRVKAMNRGLCAGVGCFDGSGALVSFAWITAQNRDTALIGDVFTVPEARGNGLARSCILTLCRRALDDGKTPYVLCRDERVTFYEEIGFREEKKQSNKVKK